MELLVERKWCKPDYTIGRLYIDGEFFSNTLEDRVVDVNKNGVFDGNEKKVYGLRIGRDVPPPPQKEKMTVNSDKFKAALEALKSGKCDIGYITASYDVDADAMKLFNEAAKK